MTNEEITNVLKQLAMPENNARAVGLIQTAAAAAKAEELLKTFLGLFTGFVIGDDKQKYLSPPQVAAWMLEAVHAIANGPGSGDLSATPEALINRLQAIVDALRAATAAVKN